MLEKRLAAVAPQLFTANGGSDGLISVADTSLFKVKQEVIVSANTLPNLDQIEVKRIVSATAMYVGPKGGNIDSRINVSAYTTALSAKIFANEQKRPSIPFEEYTRAVYDEEPIVADRVVAVDKYGQYYTIDNPLPVELSDGSISIGTVNAELEVQLSHKDGFPNPGDIADSVRLGDGTNYITSTNIGSDVGLDVNIIGGANVEVDVDAADGDNIGLKVQQRSLSPSDLQYTKRVTAITGTGSDADTTSIDVALHDEDGNAYTINNPLYVNSREIVNFLKTPLDFFGNTSISNRTNQIEVPLDDTNYTNYVDTINVSTGSISQANGQVTLTTGTNANGRYAIVSKDFVRYRPGTEIGWGFTWSFPTPSISGVTLRIGATDDATNWTNGVYFQHDGGVFSLVYRRSGSTIFSVPTSSWIDQCNGAANSNYVDFSGSPQAIDITKDQLARIRAGLFGHAGFIVEILAPNQTWVKIYEYGNINTADVSIFGTFDLKVAAEVKKVAAGSGVYLLRSACWAGWTGSSLTRVSEPISDRTLAQVTRTIIEGRSSTGGGTYVPVKVTPSGSLTTEADIASIAQITGQETMANSVPVVIASDQSNIPVEHNGAVVSIANSTSTLLGANQTFLGASEDVLQYGVINIVVRSNVSSANDGLQFLFSIDNVNFYSSDEYTILAGKFKTYSLAPVARYFKVQYTNGSSAQSQFLLQTTYKQIYVKPSSHRLQDPLSPQDDAEVVQSILVAKLPDNEFTNIRTTVEGNLITDFAQNQKDAFDRLITVYPIQLKSYDHRINKHSDTFDEVITGSATSVHNPTRVVVELTTTTNAADSVVRQSYQSFEYVRGNTQQGLFSLNVGGGPKTNNIRIFGIGDSENGAFIGVDATGFFIMRRSKTTGSVVDTKVYQSSFNQDILNGTGKSKISLDLTKQNLFSISYSWLGTNVITFAIAVAGVKYPFHVENVGNILDTAWCQSGQLPLYFQNTNTGITSSSTTFYVGCSAIYSYGSSKGFAEYQSVSTGVTASSISTTEKVVAGIRLRPNLKYVTIEPADYEIMPVSGTAFAYYKVILRPTLTGATWANYGNISQILTNTPTYANGFLIQEGYLNLSTATRVAVNIPSTLETTLGYSISGVPDALIIVIQTTTGAGSVLFAGSWKEVY